MPETVLLCASFAPEWRNWYTHQTQNLANFTVHVGSSPTSGTIESTADSAINEHRNSCWKILLRVYSRKSAAKFYFKILTLLDRHDVPRGRDCETKSTKVRTPGIGLVKIHVQAAQVLFRRQLVQVKRACVYRRLSAAESARHREPRELD